MKTVVTHQLETREEKCDGNSSDDSEKVGSRVNSFEGMVVQFGTTFLTLLLLV